ncbi:hypothetical protein C7N43_12050 [Sphingobacteriales bacterium UPWRP_1]|nr:hypothetical protein BVG80_06020 [Sphingobacteriales bacterium TSM_CSM]PSJ76758.1 hypothetical protein C7N43_12050 [Sphingobacteriales bacterium UPWRP_1]
MAANSKAPNAAVRSFTLSNKPAPQEAQAAQKMSAAGNDSNSNSSMWNTLKYSAILYENPTASMPRIKPKAHRAKPVNHLQTASRYFIIAANYPQY